MMKQTAFLINTSRGPVVDEAALADALNTGRIAGAAADTLSTEPPKADNPLLTAKNCFITPHLAWATAEAKGRLVDVLVNNIKAFAEGTPINVVNG
jgi:glycerate dehydrogenase